MVIDVTTYNGEADLFDLRYNVLKDYVDKFIVIQFDKTFSGENRVFTVPNGRYPKASFVLHSEEQYEKYREIAESSPNTIGADHWKREFMQKESIKDALTHLNDDDIVYLGDVDEVYRPYEAVLGVTKLKLDVYTYYLNNKSTEEFWGTIVARYRDIKDACLNHLRSNPDAKTSVSFGWHFTSMGGPEALKKKLTDSYTQESYATHEVLENVAYNIENGKDFLGRNFNYTVTEEEWPQYLKDNRERYKHLLKEQPM